MANIGLTNIWFSNLTEGADGTATYEGATNLGKAVSCSVSITNNSAKLYGDDVLAESDTSFASGTITLGVTDDNDAVFAPLLGHTIDAGGEVIKASTDTAPYVGIGRIVTKMVGGAYKYKVEFLYKVKFSEPSKDETTKGENIEFSTPSVEGMISALDDTNGTWSKSKTFNTKSDALTYLKNLMAAPSATYRVTYDLMGGTSSTIEDETVNAGSSVNLDDGTNITAPSGKVFVGWATRDDATTPNVTSPYTPSGDVTLYAIYTNEE
jgi:phi13 family phage major tail protein